MIADLSLMVTSLLVGSLLMGTIGLRCAVEGLDTGTEVHVRQQIIGALRRVMPVLMTACILTTGLAACQSGGQPKQGLAVLGFTLCVAVFAITLSVHSPLNRVFLTWHEVSPPPNAQHMFDRWNRWDSIRAAVATAALFSMAFAVMRWP